MKIPAAIKDDVRRREGRNCRACGSKDGSIVFPIHVPVTSSSHAIQICVECRQAEKERRLGMSGDGNGVVDCYGTIATRSGHWTTRVRP